MDADHPRNLESFARCFTALIPASIYARSTPSFGGDGPDIAGYSTLLASVDVEGTPLVAAFTVRHQADGRWYYNAVTLHDPNRKARDSNGRPARQDDVSGFAPLAGLGEFSRKSLARVNPEAVSKVVDSATGEPLVVYHGTGKDFTEFQEGKRQSQYGGGLYFGRDPKVASSFASPLRGPAPNVMPVYLSLQNPFIETGDYKQTRTNQNKRNSVKSLNFLVNFGPPDRARTCYLLLRRQLLYPDELQADDLKNKPWYLRKVAGFIGCFGAGERNRTLDLLITKP